MSNSRTITTDPEKAAARRWALAEAVYRNADAQDHKACQARLTAGKAISETLTGSARSNWPHISRHPTVAPLLAAEEAARNASRAALLRLISTPASDWRAWVVKAELVREWADHLVSPLVPTDRKEAIADPKHWPGSIVYAELHHFALALHCGVCDPKLAARMVPRLLRLCSQINTVPDAKSDETVPFGLAMLLADAQCLAGTV